VSLENDGWRAIAFIGREQVLLQSRSGKPLHRYFPDVISQLALLRPGTVIDGELVVWNAAAGRTSFAALQQRIVAGRGMADLVAARPAHLVCFDLLEDGGTELLGEPLVQRRDRLTSVLTGAPAALQLCPQTADFDEARQWISELPPTGVEGVVVKGAETPYRPGQPDWAKFRIYMSALAVIAGVAGTLAGANCPAARAVRPSGPASLRQPSGIAPDGREAALGLLSTGSEWVPRTGG
jgi:ATP-dependent DNA ligase